MTKKGETYGRIGSSGSLLEKTYRLFTKLEEVL